MNNINVSLSKILSSRKYISIIYTLWIAINYLYLQDYLLEVSRTAYHGDMGHLSMTTFLSYIILTYSLVTFAYFLRIIWWNNGEQRYKLSTVIIKTILTTAMLYVVIATPYYLKGVYEELPRYKFWGGDEWYGLDSSGNFTTLKQHPALKRFDIISYFSYISCIIISVFIYLRESSRETDSRPVVKIIIQTILLYHLYAIVSNFVFFIVSSPCFVLLAMARLRIIPYKLIRNLIYGLIIAYVLGTITVCGLMGNEMGLTGAGPVSVLYIVALFGGFFNVWIYLAVFIGLIFVWIKHIRKLKGENTFFKGFIAGLISTLILLFIICI